MATHSSILAWRIAWTEEPGRLWSIGLLTVRHDWNDLRHTHAHFFASLLYFLCIHLRIDSRVCGTCEWHRDRTAGATVPSGQLLPVAQIAPQHWHLYASSAAWETWVMPGRWPLEQVPRVWWHWFSKLQNTGTKETLEIICFHQTGHELVMASLLGTRTRQ